MPEMTGGCLCGQVRYSANTEPAFVGVCHCKNCQKQFLSSRWHPKSGDVRPRAA
jgi:hypothetical protein